MKEHAHAQEDDGAQDSGGAGQELHNPDQYGDQWPVGSEHRTELHARRLLQEEAGPDRDQHQRDTVRLGKPDSRDRGVAGGGSGGGRRSVRTGSVVAGDARVAGCTRGRAEAIRVAASAGQAVLSSGDVLPDGGMVEVGGSPAFRRVALAAVAQAVVVIAVAVDAFGRSLAQGEPLNGVAAAGTCVTLLATEIGVAAGEGQRMLE